MLVRNSMIASECRSLTIADEVASRIADMGDNSAIIAQGARYDSGRHSNPPGSSRAAGFIYRVVRSLNQTTQKPRVRFPSRRVSEIGQHALDRTAGCNFS